jgi:hypothetical protein
MRIGAISAASTTDVLAGDPDVTKTNHGSASDVIIDPIPETISDTRSGMTPGRLTIIRALWA